tara:strand:- start:501 stop:899 length:399 start_codon:yes stop_codon:yes gene_type:complete
MDSRKRRDGAAIEQVGWYNPIDPEHSYDLKSDRIMHWLGEGAVPTDAAQKLIRRSGLAHRWHLIKQGHDDDTIDKEMKKWVLKREDTKNKRKEKAVKKADTKKDKEMTPDNDNKTKDIKSQDLSDSDSKEEE